MIIINKKLPIKIWAEKKDIIGYEGVINQAIDLANHPLARKWIALMPDFHVGYGMPIGGIVATEGGVIPNAVGVDIGCGMISAQTNLSKTEVNKEQLEKIRLMIHKLVPVGFIHHKKPQHSDFFKRSTSDIIIKSQLKAADFQVGTLGGGNHFIEIQSDEKNIIWIMIHSGSRNLGKRVADYYHKIALDYTGNDTNLPNRDLAYIPDTKPEYNLYLQAMNYCLSFAEASRLLMLERVLAAFRNCGIEIQIKQRFDTHHNFAAFEKHYGNQLLIHRKGAVKAESLLTIPGSMGTASYICEGLRPKESFNSCSHGAGRTIGRKEADRNFTYEQAVKSMQHVVYHVRQGHYDELPMAYKNIDRIIMLQNDLIKPIYKLIPLAVVKG